MRTDPQVARPQPVTLMYAGWQVWDGAYGPVRVGEEIVASVEFVQLSTTAPVEDARPLGLERLRANCYRAVAQVVDTEGTVTLDVGEFRILRWVRPGEGPGEFESGATIMVEVSLSFNAWPGAAWTTRAGELYGALHRWRVDRIARYTVGRDDSTMLSEATIETVDDQDANQYCLVDCVVLA